MKKALEAVELIVLGAAGLMLGTLLGVSLRVLVS